MNKIRIAIVEDEQEASDWLVECLERYQEEKVVNFSISRYYNAESFMGNCQNAFDIIFMDIELPDGDGMNVIAKLREKDSESVVIFVTNLSQYAIKGYEVRAFDFIVKPVSYDNFFVKLTSALNCLRKKGGKEIWITNKDGKMRLNSAHVTYIEVVQHMLIYHTTDGNYMHTGTLNKVQEELAEEYFARCNRCYLVNLKFVTAVKQTELIVGKERLQISRYKRASFLSELNNYLAGGD